MYSFEGVEAGTYTMKVSKANHVTREYTVTVDNSPIPLDAKIHLKGDINGDGIVNTSDNTLTKRCGTHFYYNGERIPLKLKGMSPIQYRTHSKAIQYLILSKFLGAFQARQPLFFYSFLSP